MSVLGSGTPTATETVSGKVALATAAEVSTGTNTTKAVVPNTMKSHLGVAKAWVNFNGTGTVSIRGSHNVSSITDLGVGEYTVNLTAAMANANYAVAVNASWNGGFGTRTGWAGPQDGVAWGTTSLKVVCQQASYTLYDPTFLTVVFFGA